MKPFSHRNRIVAHETPRTAMIQVLVLRTVVIGIMLPIQTSLKDLASIGANVVELKDLHSNTTVKMPNGIGVLAVIVMPVDDIAIEHKLSFLIKLMLYRCENKALTAK
jgi:hypothetical protein